MKKLILILLVATLHCQANTYKDSELTENCAYADCSSSSYLYANAMSGPNWVPHFEYGGIEYDLRTGYLISGSIGYSWYYGMRVEAEYAFRKNGIKTVSFFGGTYSTPGHYLSNTYMANFIWNMPLDEWISKRWGLKPLVGIGVGYDDQHLSGNLGIMSFNIKKKTFAGQVMAGLAYSILPSLDISLEYICHKGGLHDLYNHSLGAALNYHFYSWGSQRNIQN